MEFLHPRQGHTFAEIIQTSKALSLGTAVSLIDGDYQTHCSLPLIDSVVVDGRVVSLSLVSGKYAAIYVRVSSEKQKEDGWAIADQHRWNISHCLKNGWAFRIFNDQALLGATSWKSPYLQQKAALARANRYRETYERVFLNDTSTIHTTPSERQRIITFLEEKVKAIRSNEDGQSDKAGIAPSSTGTGWLWMCLTRPRQRCRSIPSLMPS